MSRELTDVFRQHGLESSHVSRIPKMRDDDPDRDV
jgi:hypothetical protein